MKRNLFVLIFAMIFPTAMALLYFLVMANESGEANPAQQMGYTFGKGFQFLLPVIYVWFASGAFPKPSKPRWQGMGFGLGFGLLVFGVMLTVYFLLIKGTPLVADTPTLIQSKLQQFGLKGLTAYIFLALFVSLIHSLLEEYYWRWFVFKGLREHTSMTQAMLWSSLAFMAHHVVVLYVYLPGYFWTAAVPISLCIAIGGAVWAWLYEKTDNIYAAWLSHAVIDAAIFVVGYDLYLAS